MSRTDDVINVAGHRLSTGEMEEIVAQHPEVVECAVVGVKDAVKGPVPMCFAVLKANSKVEKSTLQKEIVQLVRNKLGPVASLKSVHIVKRLPKTRSGKILRKTIVQIVDKETYSVPATIDDASVLAEIENEVAGN